MDTRQTLPCGEENDSSRDDANPRTPTMFDSAIGMDEGPRSLGEEWALSTGGRKRTDSGCFIEQETECGGKTSGAAVSENTRINESPTRINSYAYGNNVRNIKEMKQMVCNLQEQAGSSCLTAKVFCKDNFAMAIVGKTGCRLFFPDGSLTLDIPQCALVRETVIYVYKPINYMLSENDRPSESGNLIHYGPSLICGTAGTTFLRKVKLSCRHYANLDENTWTSSRAFSVRKRETNKHSYTLNEDDVGIRQKIVDLKLSSFCLIEFVNDNQAADHIPRKAMACIFGILQTPGGRKVVHVSLVDGDPCVIKAIEDDLTNMGCKKEDVFTLRHVQIEPLMDVTFIVICRNLGRGLDIEEVSDIVKPSSMQQQEHIKLDIISNDTTTSRCIEVRQEGMTLATFNIACGTFKHNEMVKPHQADQYFSFDVSVPLKPEERSAIANDICTLHGLEVYEGTLASTESNPELQGNAVGDINDTKDVTNAASLPVPVRSQRKLSVSAAGNPGVPTIREDDDSEAPSPRVKDTRRDVLEPKLKELNIEKPVKQMIPRTASEPTILSVLSEARRGRRPSLTASV